MKYIKYAITSSAIITLLISSTNMHSMDKNSEKNLSLLLKSAQENSQKAIEFAHEATQYATTVLTSKLDDNQSAITLGLAVSAAENATIALEKAESELNKAKNMEIELMISPATTAASQAHQAAKKADMRAKATLEEVI